MESYVDNLRDHLKRIKQIGAELAVCQLDSDAADLVAELRVIIDRIKLIELVLPSAQTKP